MIFDWHAILLVCYPVSLEKVFVPCAEVSKMDVKFLDTIYLVFDPITQFLCLVHVKIYILYFNAYQLTYSEETLETNQKLREIVNASSSLNFYIPFAFLSLTNAINLEMFTRIYFLLKLSSEFEVLTNKETF